MAHDITKHKNMLHYTIYYQIRGMETKEELMTGVKEWVQTDNEIAKLRAHMKVLNERKKTLTTQLLDVMKTNEIDCFDIKGGSINYKKNNVKKPLSAKTLFSSLTKFYENDPDTAEQIGRFILDDRETQVKESIKRRIDK